MAEKRATEKGRTQKTTKGAASKMKSSKLSAEELAAMKATLRERKAEERRGRRKEEGESDVLAKIAEMPKTDRAMATRLHELIKEAAPALSPKTWYGMPAYANEDGKVVCFFQSSATYKVRYSTFGFQEAANIDEGNMWPTAFALEKLTPAEEKRIVSLVKKAVR